MLSRLFGRNGLGRNDCDRKRRDRNLLVETTAFFSFRPEGLRLSRELDQARFDQNDQFAFGRIKNRMPPPLQ